MPAPKEQVLFENAAYRLTGKGLQQHNGLSARLEGPDKLIITREGHPTREITIPSLPTGSTGMRSSIPILTAMYNLAMHELMANVQQDGTMLAGANWSTVWTRDIAFTAALGATLAAPQEVLTSLKSRVKDGIIMQDTGTGGGWPISTDRVSWALGAWNLYLSLGDRGWLKESCTILRATLAQDDTILPKHTPLRPGETSFLDWREQSYPDWMTPADIGASYAFSTNVLHYMALNITSRMLSELEQEDEAATYRMRAQELGKALNQAFWNRANNQYSMLLTPDGCMDEHTDALANALAVISGLAGEHAEHSMSSLPRSPWGTPAFAPYKPGSAKAYHNRAIWPFQEAFVLRAHAEMRDTAGAAFSMASILRAALAFGSNKENFHAETGEATDTIQNSDRQLWSVAGMLGLFYYALFGINYEHDSIVFTPCVPKAFAGSHWLTNLHIRDMVLNVRINGYGTDICSVLINGKPATPILPLDTVGNLQIEIELMPEDSEEPDRNFPEAYENLQEPEWDSPTLTHLRWLPVEGATSYYVFANGTALGTTPECSFPISRPAPFRNVYRVQAIGHGNSSRLSRPAVFHAEGSLHELTPQSIGENAEYPVENHQAWLDTKPCTALLDYGTVALAAGTYELSLQYSNATASLRDGDSCALRELLIDGEPAGIIPLPHNTEPGNWEQYTHSAPITIPLTSGRHHFSLRYNPANCKNSNGELNQCMVRTLTISRIS